MKRITRIRFLVLIMVLVIIILPLTARSEIRVLDHPIDIGAAVTTAVTTPIVIPRNMVAFQMVVKIPDTTNGVTFTVALTDGSDRVIKTYSGLADNTGTSPHVLKPVVVVQNGYKLSITPSGATGNAITITTTISYSD